jgi:hypothetical protein
MRGGNMKRKHGRESTQVKVITDPKKLAWLKAEIEKKKAGVKPRATFKRTALNTE